MSYLSFSPISTFIYSLLFFLALVFFNAGLAQPNKLPINPIQQLYIFGDSMSDNGHDNKRDDERYALGEDGILHFAMPAPYFEGRFTNGKVWPELLSEKMHLSPENVFNYAYGGATVQKDIYPVPNLDMQINYSITRQAHNNPDSLYVIWIGANDLLNYCNSDTSKKNNDDIFVHELISNMEKNIRKLITHGAKQFLIPEQIDLSMNPQSIEKNKTEKGYAQRLQNIVGLYNKANNHLIIKLRQELPEIKFYNFNFSHLFPAGNELAQFYGFNHLQEACLNHYNVCENPNEYIFWDKLHPTTKVHSILAEEIFNLISTK